MVTIEEMLDENYESDCYPVFSPFRTISGSYQIYIWHGWEDDNLTYSPYEPHISIHYNNAIDAYRMANHLNEEFTGYDC